MGFEDVEEEIDELKGRLDDLETRIGGCIDKIDEAIGELHDELQQEIDEAEHQLDAEIGGLESRILQLELEEAAENFSEELGE